MKKFIFPIFAICMCGPSFGACNHIYGPVPNGNKYLESRFHFTNYPAYLQCGDFTTNDAQCTQGDIVVGKDRYLYRCTDAGWVKVNGDDTDLPDCKGSRQQNVGLDPVIPSKEQTYMYLVKYTSGSEQTSYRCKMKHREDQDAKNTCIITCGDYYGGICNRDHANDIVVKIVDTDNKAITSASIKYPDLTTPNNIATQKGNGNYAICLNEANNNLNVQISAQGYKSITKTVKQLLSQNNQQPITLQKNTPSNSTQSTSSLPGVATDQRFITTDPSNKLIITCENKGDINCKLPAGHNLTPLTDCTKLKKDLITETNVLYINAATFDKCSDQIGKNIDKSSCPAIQRVFLGERSYLLYCITNPNIEVRYTNQQTDAWSYEHKRCVGSWGEWKNGECDCSALDGAENVDNECMCTKNKKQKYYNKLWSGCETLEDGVYQAGTKTKILGFWEDLSKIDRANSCSPSGGKWSGNEKNECICSPTLNMEPDSNGYFCNCKEGYDYTDPMAKSNGCSLKSEINYDSNDISTEFQSSEQVAPTGTEEYECTKSGGDKYENGKCICDADKHLEEYKPENAQEYSICRCMYGYKRKGGTLGEDGRTITKYPDGAECEYAGTETVEKVFDSAQWRKDTEDAYRHEYDHTQSDANKALTAGSTLLTGEGAMMAAQAIAEKRADERAEREMAQYITTMKCEYGGGQQVNLGKEETLPFGELSKYYTEYKQLADKLKETKTALNLRPGIENEVLYEKAETGLYHYQTAETGGGGFTSVARALMNPDGADATAWNAQKAEVAQNLQTGTLLTAGGVVVGAAGNYLLNRNHKPLELKRKFKEIKTKLENDYPEIFTVPVISTPEPEPEQPEPTPEPVVAPTEEIHLELPPVYGPGFKYGDYELENKGKQALDEAINLISQALTAQGVENTRIKIHVIGHSDRDRVKPNKRYKDNYDLSRKRATKVLDYLRDGLTNKNLDSRIDFDYSNIEGRGPDECVKGEDPQKCRRVDIEVTDITNYQQQ